MLLQMTLSPSYGWVISLYIHTYMYTPLYTHIRVHTFIYIRMCTHLYIHTYVYTPLYTHIRVHTFIYIHMYTHLYIQTYVCTHHVFIHSPLDAHWHWLHVLPAVNSVAVNIRTHVSFWIMFSSRCMPRSGTTRSYGSSVFSFLRNLYTVIPQWTSTCIPTNSIGGFLLLHTLCSIYYL